MAITVTLVGAQDGVLEERLRAAGMRPVSIAPSELQTFAHPVSSPPDVVVLDLRSQSHIPPAAGLIKRQHPDTGLIIVASSLDPALMLEAMRLGVTECITDIDRGDLEAAVIRLVAQRAQPIAGEVFVLVGAKGGVGTTTAAVNIATALSTLGSTLVVDLHLAGGDAALFLGADSHFSIVDALENTHRLDASFFRGLVSRTKAGPDLLASVDRPAAMTVEPPRVRTLIDFVSHHYRYTVLDIPRSDAAVLDALENVAKIVIVANQELATVRSAGRMATTLRQRYGKSKVETVLSRSDREAEIGPEDLQNAVGGPVAHTFPSDYRLAVKALNRGQPVVSDNKTALGTAFQDYARQLAGVGKAGPGPKTASVTKGSGGLLGRLTGRR